MGGAQVEVPLGATCRLGGSRPEDMSRFLSAAGEALVAMEVSLWLRP